MRFLGWEIRRVSESLNSAISTTTIRSADSDNLSENKNLQFNMYFAEGGVIMQSYYYDHIKDRTLRKLHIIPEDKDVATEVGNIISMELLRTC